MKKKSRGEIKAHAQYVRYNNVKINESWITHHVEKLKHALHVPNKNKLNVWKNKNVHYLLYEKINM